MRTTARWQRRTQELSRNLIERDLSDFSPRARVIVYPIRVAVRTVEEFLADKCLQRASALAFASLLALVPVTAIFFFVLTKLEGFSDLRLRIEDFLFSNFVPARTDVVREYLIQYTQNVTLLGVFGVVALFITAIFLFNTIEHTFNDIWHAKRRRPFLSKFTAFWTVLTATPLLTLLSFYIAAKLAAQNLDIFSLKFLTYVLNWLAFWFAYQFIPYTNVRVRAAAAGAIVGGTLWELAKGGFNWYIANMTSFDKIYGSLGAIPVFLLWIYLTWLIVLFGTEVAYAVQYPQVKSQMSSAEMAGYLEFYSVRSMAEIARRFTYGDGRDASTIDTLKEVGIPPELLGRILNRLSEKRLVSYTEDKEYVPARHPATITVRDVIEAVSETKMRAPDDVTDPISNRLKETFQEVVTGANSALEGLNLQMLIDEAEKKR
ncbi:MAG: YihY family inner membrane protein [Candidatus Abyssobacteria bacterium SURF_17]|uniref:YihY family inner membrane protein n=1 Tax=Candidatus Abyssobacteria bacterium SURF_17 TaxID=2093361 RepID=A0A419ETI1_9BACT|nr:MAG: YihY family inner membrane protein [Candidatus Abyssubacteria bacterium SURF_17]